MTWAKALFSHFQLINAVLLVTVLGLGVGLPFWLLRRAARHASRGGDVPGGPGDAAPASPARTGRRGRWLGAGIALLVALAGIGFAVVITNLHRRAPDAATTPWTNYTRLEQKLGLGTQGVASCGDEEFRYEIQFDEKSVALTVSYRKQTDTQYRVLIEDPSGRTRALAEGGLVSTSRVVDGIETVREKKMLSRREFDRIVALVLQKRKDIQTGSQLVFGPMMERFVSLSDVDAEGILFIDLERNQAQKPPMPVRFFEKLGLELTPVLSDWLRSNRVDLLVQLVQTKVSGSATKSLAAHLRGVNLQAVAPLDEQSWRLAAASPAASPWQSLVPTAAVIASRLVGQGARTYHALLRTQEGSLVALEFDDDPAGAVKLRYKLVQAPTEPASLKPIPPRAMELYAAWKSYAKDFARTHNMADTNVVAELHRETDKRFEMIETELAGTLAEPLVRQQHEQVAELGKARRAGDPERIRAAADHLRLIEEQLVEMLGITNGVPAKPAGLAAAFQVRWVAAEGNTNAPADVLPLLRPHGDERELRVLREVVLSGRDVESAGFTKYQPDQKELLVLLTQDGGEKFHEATTKNVGRRLAIVWDGKVINAPVVRSAVAGRQLLITGRYTDAEAQRLLDLLNHRGTSTTGR